MGDIMLQRPLNKKKQISSMDSLYTNCDLKCIRKQSHETEIVFH